jgi:hypothetical protein
MRKAVEGASTSENSVQRIAEILIQVSDVERSLGSTETASASSWSRPATATGHSRPRSGKVRLLVHPDFDDSLRGVKRGAGVLIHLWVPDADAYCEPGAETRRHGS